MTVARRACATLLWLAPILVGACASSDPEIVAIEYLRASRTGNADAAVRLLDLDRIVERVEEEIVLVNTEGDPEAFLRDSVRSTAWALFQETPREERSYDARPAEIDGDRATVRVLLTEPEGGTDTRVVHLRRTGSGWKVSGPSIDDIVSSVIQRLQDRF